MTTQRSTIFAGKVLPPCALQTSALFVRLALNISTDWSRSRIAGRMIRMALRHATHSRCAYEVTIGVHRALLPKHVSFLGMIVMGTACLRGLKWLQEPPSKLLRGLGRECLIRLTQTTTAQSHLRSGRHMIRYRYPFRSIGTILYAQERATSLAVTMGGLATPAAQTSGSSGVAHTG